LTGEDKRAKLRSEVEKTGIQIVETLSGIMKYYTDNDFAASIKVLESPTDFPATEEEWGQVMVRCIIRSKNSDPERNEYPPQRLMKNHHFRTIAKDEANAFSSTNLIEFNQTWHRLTGRIYDNSTPNYLNFYKSLIVVPIRMERKYLGLGSPKYDLIGFLCVDSRTTGAFKSRERTNFEHLMMFVADQLYTYLRTSIQLSRIEPTTTATLRDEEE
jgi:hypothetical protein